MGMSNVRYVPEPNVSPNARMTLFFDGVLGALERFRSNRAASLADEARRLCRGAMTKILTKMAYEDLTPLEEHIKPVISRIDGVRRIQGQRRD